MPATDDEFAGLVVIALAAVVALFSGIAMGWLTFPILKGWFLQ